MDNQIHKLPDGKKIQYFSYEDMAVLFNMDLDFDNACEECALCDYAFCCDYDCAFGAFRYI